MAAHWPRSVELARRKFKVKYPKLCGGVKHYSGGYKLCKRPGLQPIGRCKFHGGASLIGENAPRYEHGKYSKFKKKILQRIEEYKKDPNLRDLTNELAILKGLLEAAMHKEEDLLKPKTLKMLSFIIGDISKTADTMKKINEGYTLNIKSVNTVIVKIVNIIQNRVTDAKIRRQIAEDIRALDYVNT